LLFCTAAKCGIILLALRARVEIQTYEGARACLFAGVDADKPSIEATIWESLALDNAMTALATSRRYTWQSVGALGVIELTAPGRSAMVARGLRRIGLTDKERRYFELHAVLDVKHSADWNREALRPLVAEDPRCAIAIAEGALIRLTCGARCFERYRAILWS